MPALSSRLAYLLIIIVFTGLCGTGTAHDGPHDGDDHVHGDHEHTEPVVAKNVSIVVKNGFRYISSNGLPDHTPGQFPNRNNPNRMTQQRHQFKVPVTPTVAWVPIPRNMGKFGVALNGVPFDPGAAEFWQRNFRSGWQYDAMGPGVNLGLDQHNAHVQPTGSYHYHGIPTGLLKRLAKPGTMTLLGYAADGYPIYSSLGHTTADDAESELKTLRSGYRLREGTRPNRPGPGGKYDGTFVQDWEFVPGAGDLDASNGRVGVTPEYPNGTYYYVLTDEYPYIPRQLHGVPDASFNPGPPGGGRMQGPGGRPPRPFGIPPRRPF